MDIVSEAGSRIFEVKDSLVVLFFQLSAYVSDDLNPKLKKKVSDQKYLFFAYNSKNDEHTDF